MKESNATVADIIHGKFRSSIQRNKKGQVDINWLDVGISKHEGLKTQVNIAQIKEIRGCLIELMARMEMNDVLGILNRTRWGRYRGY